MIEIKECTRCDRTKTHRWHRKTTDHPICNTCHAREWREQNPELAKARAKVQNNSKNSIAARKKYLSSEKWKARKRELDREEYWKDPEDAKAKKAKYGYKNPNYVRDYYRANKAAYHEREIRRSKNLNAASLGGVHLEAIVEVYEGRPDGYEVDHIIPIKGKDFIDGKRQHVVCGLHVPWNLQYLTKEENRKKGCNLYSCPLLKSEEV